MLRLKKKCFTSALGLLAVSPVAIIAACANSPEQQPELPPADQPQPGLNLDLNQRIERQQQLVQFNNRVDRIEKTNLQRKIPTQTYQTTITDKYGSDFKYPA